MNNGSSSARGAATVVWLCGLLSLCILCLEDAKAGDPEPSAEAWLDKVSTAAQRVNYEGTFVYRRDDQLATMQIIHVADAQGGRERLISLSGGRQELLRSKEGVVSIFSGQKHLTFNKEGLDKHFPGRIAGHVEDLEKSYRLVLAGRDRIAGRNARLIVVEPKDSYRYGYRLWVDEGTGLLLQFDLVNEHGNAIEQVMFTSVNVRDKATPAMVQAVTMSEAMQRSLKASKQETVSPTAMPWQITKMPNGFSLAEHYQHANGKQDTLEQVVLSDGMATVSVFVERLRDNAKPFEGASHMGAVNAFGRVVDHRQLTVVGEVPAATVRMIGHSLAGTSLDFAKAGQ